MGDNRRPPGVRAAVQSCLDGFWLVRRCEALQCFQPAMTRDALLSSTGPALDGLLVCLGIPVLQQRDGWGAFVFGGNADQETAIGSDIVLLSVDGVRSTARDPWLK